MPEPLTVSAITLNCFVILSGAIGGKPIAESKDPCNLRTIVAALGNSHRTVNITRMPCHTCYAASFTGVLRLRDKPAGLSLRSG
jgi:hypothetical protein